MKINNMVEAPSLLLYRSLSHRLSPLSLFLSFFHFIVRAIQLALNLELLEDLTHCQVVFRTWHRCSIHWEFTNAGEVLLLLTWSYPRPIASTYAMAWACHVYVFQYGMVHVSHDVHRLSDESTSLMDVWPWCSWFLFWIILYIHETETRW